MEPPVFRSDILMGQARLKCTTLESMVSGGDARFEDHENASSKKP